MTRTAVDEKMAKRKDSASASAAGPVTVGRALGGILKLAVQVAFALLITASNSVMALGWVGQFLKSEVLMSGVALGILVFNITGISILFGVSSGLNTLLAQAEGRGSETVLMRRMYVNRMVLVMFACAIPLGVLNWFSGPLLLAAGQPAEVVEYATTYAHVLFLGTLLPSMAFYLQQQVVNTRREAFIPLLATILGTGTQVTFSLYFLRGFEEAPANQSHLPLGNQSYIGAAVSRSAGSFVSVGLTGLYLIFTRDQICPSGCFCCAPNGRGGARRRQRRDEEGVEDVASLRSDEEGDEGGASVDLRFWRWSGGFQLLLALCGPSMLLMISEWWGFEALAIMAGNLPNPDLNLDTNGVLYNINLMIYQLYRGFGVGTSVYVGNNIGRKCDLTDGTDALRDVVSSRETTESENTDEQPRRCCSMGDRHDDGTPLDERLVSEAAQDAKLYCWTGLVSGIVLQVAVSAAYYIFRSELASIFTEDAEVIDQASNTTLAASVAALGYSMLMPANMVLQAMGLQIVGAIITSFAYFVVGLPLAGLMAFTAGMGLNGVWWANAVALTLAGALTLLYILVKIDWKKEVRIANVRMRKASKAQAGARPELSPSGSQQSLEEPLLAT